MMVRPLASLFALLCSGLFLAGCMEPEETPRCSEAECGPFELRDAYIPFAFGNQWTYAETTFTDTGFHVGSSTREFFQLNFWAFIPQPNPYFGNFGQRNDTVYQSISSMGGGTQVSLRYFPPPGPDTIVFDSRIDEDVSRYTTAAKIPGSFPTPAGTFGNCAWFLAGGYGTPTDYKTFICDGIGIVGQDEYNISGDLKRRSRLTAYTLIK